MSKLCPDNIQSAENSVRIVVDDYIATIYGAIDRIVPLLGCHRRKFDLGSAGRLSQQLAPTPFIWLSPAGRPVMSPGLVPFLVTQLQNEGTEVEVIDRRVLPPEFAPNQTVIDQTADVDRPLVNAVCAHPRGQIHIRGVNDLIHYIALIARLFPTRSILIIAATRKRAWKLWQGLRWKLRVRIQLAKGTWPKRERIVVCMPCHLRQPTEWDIVLLPDALALTGIQMIGRVVTAFRGPKLIYAFPPANARLSRFQRLAIENVSGPVIHQLEPELADVYVHVILSGSSPRTGKLQGLPRKRKAYWHNDLRNDDIARFASAAASSNTAALRQDYGLLVDDADDAFGSLPNPVRVNIIVESVEHGHELLLRLPGWRLLHSGPDDPEGDIVASAIGTIVTFVHAGQHGIDADIVIRADGGGDQLHVRNFPPPATDHRPRILLVDVDDDFDRPARRQTGQRIDGYARRGWVITDPTGLRRDPATHLYAPEFLKILKSTAATNRAHAGTGYMAGKNPANDTAAHQGQPQHKCRADKAGNQPVLPRTLPQSETDALSLSGPTHTPVDGHSLMISDPSDRHIRPTGETGNRRIPTNTSTPARRDVKTRR